MAAATPTINHLFIRQKSFCTKKLGPLSRASATNRKEKRWQKWGRSYHDVNWELRASKRNSGVSWHLTGAFSIPCSAGGWSNLHNFNRRVKAFENTAITSYTMGLNTHKHNSQNSIIVVLPDTPCVLKVMFILKLPTTSVLKTYIPVSA